MKYSFINQTPESRELVLFFNGWGMDENIFKHWEQPSFNLLEIHDYSEMDNVTELQEEIKSYKSCIVVAWSMGVWAYTAIAQQLALPLERAIALNGTPNPVHDDWGIPLRIYQATLDNFSKDNRNKFFRRMCSSGAIYRELQKHLPDRTVEQQYRELLKIQEICSVEPENWHHPFQACLISEKDLIIPSGNQFNYWNGRAEITNIPGGHYPFYLWNSWEDMLEQLFQSR